jgi:putative redox protein
MTAEIEYLGALRTKLTHVASGDSFITDAPVDNHGRGEAFSPTDTVASALGSCMLTMMGIYAQGRDLDLKGTRVFVTKHMAANPRRISKVEVVMKMVSVNLDEITQKHLEKVALTCPVAMSLHPEIEQAISFEW